MKYSKKLLFINLCLLLLSTCVSSMQLTLTDQQFCLDYQVQYAPSTKVFYFHYNHNSANVRLVLYKANSGQILRDSGLGFEYDYNIKVLYNQTGNYTFCLVKSSEGVAEVVIDIMDEEELSGYAGKEDLTKVSRRISQFLMDIKRVGWTFRNVLQQHNKRKNELADRDNYYAMLLIVKILVMLAIIGIQVFAVKQIFK